MRHQRVRLDQSSSRSKIAPTQRLPVGGLEEIQDRRVAPRDRAQIALGPQPAQAATDRSHGLSRRGERVPKRVGPADDRGADHQDQPDPAPPDGGILDTKPRLLRAHPEGSSGSPGSPRRDPLPETRTEKTMADPPSCERPWSGTIPGQRPRSIRLDRPLHPGDPIDEIGGVGGPSQIRVLRQGRRTRLVRVDSDDGE